VKAVPHTQQMSIMAAVANRRQSLAELAGKAFRKSKSQVRDSFQDLDEQTLHTMCKNVCDLFSGETTQHTASTVSCCSLEESCTAFFNSEESFTEFGEESFDMRRTSEFDISTIDFDLQKEEMEKFELQKKRSDGDDKNLIEVFPGRCLPLRGSEETWKAIMAGYITITRCTCCEEDLTCVEDTHLVICSDCWVFSPVDQSIAGISLEETEEEWHIRDELRGVGLGFKAKDILEWMNSQQKAESS
jgi:hypothetical protein